MYSSHTCPRCSSPISYERMLGQAVVCSCGWSGNKSFFDGPKRNFHLKKIVTTLAIVASGSMFYDGQSWGKHYPERMYYKAKSALRMTNGHDEARMAKVCVEIKNNFCAAESFTKALAKSPKNYSLAGSLGIVLSEIGQHDRAVLTFQNFFSHDEGNDEHKRAFARSLSNQGYLTDATEWYYKALQQNAENFDAARELIEHLAKNELHTEALSVIGHYNTLFPKTIKGWHKLSSEVKEQYSAYTSKYAIKEIKISGLNKFLHAPVQFVGSGETQLFLVDPDSEFLTVDAQKLQELGAQYKTVGEKELTATSGRSVKGNEIIITELMVGPFKLENVKAVACDGCAFLLGKDVMKALNFKSEDSKGVRYITLKQ